MTWETVSAKIIFNPEGYSNLSSVEQETILTMLQNLYLSSPTAYSILESATAGDKVLQIGGSDSEPAFNVHGANIVGINLDKFNGDAGDQFFINADGQLLPASASLALIHEITHTLGFGDPPNEPTDYQLNTPGFDDLGDTADIEGYIAQEMSWSDYVRVSYYATFPWSDGVVDLSDGNGPCDVVRLGDAVGTGSDNYIDYRAWGSVLVPKDAPLEVEAWLQNRDIGFVQPGQDVVVKIDTFNFTKYGYITGKVILVSKTAVENPQNLTSEGPDTATQQQNRGQSPQLVYVARKPAAAGNDDRRP